MNERYKFRESVHLDEWSGAHVDILVDQDDRLTVRAVDMVGDAWHDHLQELDVAQQTHASEYARNRAIQSSLSKLITHFDGVVSGLFKYVSESDSGFHVPEKKARFCTLLQKIDAIAAHYCRRTAARLPELDLDCKSIRDLLIHPYISKSLPSSRQELKQGDIFDLTVHDLKRFSTAVDRWLGAITHHFAYPRGYNTEIVGKNYCKVVYERYRAAMLVKGVRLPAYEDVEALTSRI